jgi:hypothetical protein
MTTVFVVAIFTGTFRLQADYRQMRTRHAAALRNFLAARKFYFEEGRLTSTRYVEISQCLMESELDLCPTKPQQAAVIAAHFIRVAQLIEDVRNWEVGCHDIRNLWIDEAEQLLADCKASLRNRGYGMSTPARRAKSDR